MTDPPSPRPFANKVAIVTGGASGIGEATAVAFAEAGARVTVADLDAVAGEATAEKIRAEGGEAMFVRTDVADERAVAAMVERTMEVWGRLDCAFNNAGISEGKAPGEEFDSKVFTRHLDINVKGVFFCLKYEVPAMLKHGGGAIVNTSSIMGLVGGGRHGYVASKHAIIGLTRSVAMDYAAQGIRVNAVCPAAIDTPMSQATAAMGFAEVIRSMHPVGRIGQPREVADAVLFLCSDKAGFITGHPLAIDGGFLSK